MDCDLYLKFEGELELNPSDYPGGVIENIFAHIMYATDEEAEAAEAADLDYEGTRIGFVQLLNYNQVLAIQYGIKMSEIPFMTFQYNSKALMELDSTLMSQETLDEIGEAT